ncbi:MAG: J domain-containing protein [Nitrospiraceae bacterium]|nr:MAG: J domain-containing protein [Nitrospiraceae bacterium]
MKNRRNYYRILQVQPDAPMEIIRASYRTLMRDLMQHPDLGGDHWNASIINEAYATLSDSVKRNEYDRKYLKHLSKDKICWKNISTLKSGKTHTSRHKSRRRSMNRIKMNGLHLCYMTSSQKKSEAKMLDLSPQGICFICNEKLKYASTIIIESSLFKAAAKVVYNYNISSDRSVYSVGARFTDIRFRKPSGSFYSHAV